MKLLYAYLVDSVVAFLTPKRLKIYPLFIPILLMIAWSISQFLGKGLTDIRGTIIGSDFLAFYNAGKFFLLHRMSDLYNFHEQYLFQKSIVQPIIYRCFHPYLNPPFTAYLFSFFAHGGYFQGLILWWLGGLAALFCSVLIFQQEISSLNHYSNIKMFFMCFLFFPTMAWFIYGQNTPFTLLFYTVFYVLLRMKKDFFAGCILGLISYKPQLAAVLIFLLLVNLRWRAIIGTILVVASLLALGFYIAPEAMIKYADISIHFSEILRLNPEPNNLNKLFLLSAKLNYPTFGIHSFFGFAVLLLDNIWKTGANILFIGLTLAGLLFIVFLWKKIPWEPGNKSWDFAIAITFTLTLIISPHLFIYDMMLFLLPLAIIWSYFPKDSKGKPLDGNSILFWSTLVYIFCFFGSYFSWMQLKITALLGLPQFAVQVSTIIIIGWVLSVYNNMTHDEEIRKQ